ncbi:MAG: DUF72 domain-containing protein [Promethearchaeota archaeon]
MVTFHVGCAGWSYKDWVGSFYPKGLSPKKYLEFYSRYFNFVEVNSTYYSLLPSSTFSQWNKQVPDDFSFSIKMWRGITHERYIDETITSQKVQRFLEIISKLSEKISHILIQFPRSFTFTKRNVEYLKTVIGNCLKRPEKYRVVVELRDNKWFVPFSKTIESNELEREVIELFSEPRVFLSTLYLNGILVYYPSWLPGTSYVQDEFYIRLIGDMDITKFDETQRKLKKYQDDLMEHVIPFTRNHRKEQDNVFPKLETKISDIYVVYNNHFSGFAPRDAINLKKKLHVPFIDLDDFKEKTSSQSSIMNFFKENNEK